MTCLHDSTLNTAVNTSNNMLHCFDSLNAIMPVKCKQWHEQDQNLKNKTEIRQFKTKTRTRYKEPKTKTKEAKH